MANAGRILILARGAWVSTTNYVQLDLVTYNGTAYLARAASIGVDPSTDSSYTYWQPFGSAAQIATTSVPGLVMPDGTTITVDNTGLIRAALGVSDLSNVAITSLADGQVLKYNSNTLKWENVSLGTAAAKDVPASGNASTSQVVLGSDTRLSDSRTPSAHATSSTTYGGGTATNYGHNKLTDSYTTTSNVAAANSVGASGKAVNDLYTALKTSTRKTVNTSSWSTDTTSQSGVTLYKKSIALSHVYVDSPTVEISTSSGTGLPTTAQQDAYNLLQYATVDGTTLYLYSSAIPSTTYYIQIGGVD